MRNIVSSYFSLREFPKGLSILTMPGVEWRFERHLLCCRESRGIGASQRKPRRTYICSIEQDEALFRLAQEKMPGAKSSLAILDPAPYATATVRSYLIQRFHRCQFRDLVCLNEHPFDGAWLDFTGPLTVKLLETLRAFWDRLLRYRMALTVLWGRYDREVGEGIQQTGSVAGFLESVLPGARVLCAHFYCDTAPMLQMILDKEPAP